MDFQVNIPIKPHLKKFMQYYTEVDPYKISTKDMFGRIILQELKKPTTWYPPTTIDYKEKIDIVIPGHYYVKYNKVEVTDQTIKNVNNFLNNVFFEQFRFLIFSYQKMNDVMVSQSIRNFMELYELTEDDISFEYLKRDFYRFIEKRRKKYSKNYTSFSPIKKYR